MTGQQIITAFELQVSDLTELSSTEELALLNKVYKKALSQKPYECTKKTASGTVSTSVPYVSLPADFLFMVANADHTSRGYYGQRPVVFVGDDFTPYEVVSWSDRRSVRTDTNKCYIDIRNSRLYFTVQPTQALLYEFDYHAFPDDLTLNTSPIIPSHLCWLFVHLMATEDFIVQLSDKAKSYAPENQAMAASFQADLDYWNANLVQI